MTQLKNGLITLLFIAYLLAFSCSPVSRVQAPAISTNNFRHVPWAAERNYVMMKDSSIVYGEKVSGGFGGDALLNKKVVRLDGKQIPLSEIIGFQNNDGYYTLVEDVKPARRIIKGKITVYRLLASNASFSYTALYFQKDNGTVTLRGSFSTFQQLISDCPKAYDMVNMTEDEFRRIVKKQQYYPQTVIETYNNCGEWK
ncbi:MAG: hypothetical protein ABI675_28630 [Chitinophagaceae bacterium]